VSSHRRHQHAASVGAVVLAVVAIGCGLHHLYPHAALLGAGVLALTDAALRANRCHRRELADHDWARRQGAGEHPEPLWPCCLLAQSSSDRAHSPRCTRDLTLEQFNDIVAQLKNH